MDYFAFTKELIETFGDLDLISRFFVFELVLCENYWKIFFFKRIGEDWLVLTWSETAQGLISLERRGDDDTGGKTIVWVSRG